MKLLVTQVLALAAVALAGCVAVPYDAGPPPRAYYGRPVPPPHPMHDYDRDGVPDRYDRHPDNPYLY